MVYDFSNLDHDECLGLIALARTRLKELTRQQTVVWGVKRTYKGDVRYVKPCRKNPKVDGRGTRTRKPSKLI